MIHDQTIAAEDGSNWARLAWIDEAPPAVISLKSAGDLSLSQANARADFVNEHGWDAEQVFALKQIHSQ